jgi:hypothetical protein
MVQNFNKYLEGNASENADLRRAMLKGSVPTSRESSAILTGSGEPNEGAFSRQSTRRLVTPGSSAIAFN